MTATLLAAGILVSLAADPYEIPVAGGYPPYTGQMVTEGVGPVGGYEYGGAVSQGSFGEQLFPYNAQYPWLHSYFQEIPVYGGYGAFRPYNYKHVLAQTQAAAGWGMPARSPYSQQFWHRYQDKATMQQTSKDDFSRRIGELARLRAIQESDRRQLTAIRRGELTVSPAAVQPSVITQTEYRADSQSRLLLRKIVDRDLQIRAAENTLYQRYGSGTNRGTSAVRSFRR